MVGPPQPVSTCVLYKCELIVVCRELAVLCDDLYLTVIHIWVAQKLDHLPLMDLFTKGLKSEYGNVMIVSLSFSAAFAAASASSFPRIPT